MDRFRRILVGVDLDPAAGITPGSRNALEQARWVAERTDASLLLVHSLHRDEAPPEEVAVAHPSPAAEEALEALRAQSEDAGITARVRFTRNPLWLDAIRGALRGEADLIVTGKRNRPPEDGRRLGSNAAKLVRKSPCPVWVVNPAHPRLERRVLAATDRSPVGDRVLELASWLAVSCAGELHVVHAWQIPMSLQLELGQLSDERANERLRETERELCRAIDAAVGDRVPPGGVHHHLGRMSASAAILEAVAKLDPDLLVMGSLSHSGVAGRLVGHTAERLLDRVDCSLCTVKPDDFHTPIEPE